MNINTFFYPLSLLVAAVTMTACSSDDDAATAKADRQTGTFQVSIDVGPAMTRAISVGGNDGYTLYTNWDTGDEVQVVKDGATSVAGTLTADVSAGNSAFATLNGTLTGTFAVSDQVKLYYHSANIDYTGQKGTMPDVSTNKSFLTATSTVQEIGQATGTVKDGSDKYLVMSNAAYQAMQSYLEISFTDAEGNALDITQLDIWTSGGKLVKTAPLDGDKTYATEVSPLTVTPDAATDHFFLALRDEAGASNTIYFKATTADNTYSYNQDLNLEIGEYYYAASPKAMTSIVHLNQLTSDCTVLDGQTMTGTLANNVKISIADGATVTLDNVSINADGAWKSGDYAGINCLGDVTIILKDGTTNVVKGFSENYPGIHVVSGKTLTIQGSTGTLTASPRRDDYGDCYAAGIGAGNTIACGNINIQGGIITATSDAAGIGAGFLACATCGNITISGGTITAAGDAGAGIGAGVLAGATCGNIVIEDGTITATSIRYGAGIGGGGAACGSISISGGIIEATGGLYGAGIGSGNGGPCTSITISGGTITATGQGGGSGIGGGYNEGSYCGNISITGGTIVATGSSWEGYQSAAGIGGGAMSNCGTIEITNGVTKVTATKGTSAPNSIGKGKSGTCGTVTIGGTVYWGLEEGSSTEYEYKNDGNTYLPTSPLEYPQP